MVQKRPSIPKATKEQVLPEFNHRCAICGRDAPSVTDFFADHQEEDFARVKVRRLETTETHHGRVEKRSYFPVDVPDDWKGRSRWKGLRTQGRLIRTREIHGVETDEIPSERSLRDELVHGVVAFYSRFRSRFGL